MREGLVELLAGAWTWCLVSLKFHPFPWRLYEDILLKSIRSLRVPKPCTSQRRGFQVLYRSKGVKVAEASQVNAGVT